MINIVATLLQNIQAKKEREVQQSFYSLHDGHRSSRFFAPDRNYPFIVTFLYGVINLKVSDKLINTYNANYLPLLLIYALSEDLQKNKRKIKEEEKTTRYPVPIDSSQLHILNKSSE